MSEVYEKHGKLWYGPNDGAWYTLVVFGPIVESGTWNEYGHAHTIEEAVLILEENGHDCTKARNSLGLPVKPKPLEGVELSGGWSMTAGASGDCYMAAGTGCIQTHGDDWMRCVWSIWQSGTPLATGIGSREDALAAAVDLGATVKPPPGPLDGVEFEGVWLDNIARGTVMRSSCGCSIRTWVDGDGLQRYCVRGAAGVGLVPGQLGNGPDAIAKVIELGATVKK